MVAKIFIDGEAGTTGLEIRERLTRRRDIELISIADDLRKDLGARRDMLNAADVAILCLPDDAARQSVSLIDNPDTKLIDASTAHRVDPTWTYGFAEMTPDQGVAGTRAGRHDGNAARFTLRKMTGEKVGQLIGIVRQAAGL